MQLYQNLIQIFNPNFFDITVGGGTYDVKETDSNATVKKVTFDYRGHLMSIDNSVFNKTDALFKEDENTDKGMPALRHGCDGVFVIEHNEQKYIVFIELKSSYTPDNIQKAERQIAASYLRIMMLLDCIDGVKLNQYKKCGIIVSHPLSTEKLTYIQKKKLVSGSDLTRYDKQCLRYATKKQESFPLTKQYAKLDKLPVKDSLYFGELPTFHISINHDSAQGRFNLDKLLKKL